MADPSTSKGLKTRQGIIHAAADLIHQRGVSGTSVDDVLRATGTGKSQFYYYFEDKEDLVHHVLRYQLTRYLDRQRPHIDQLSTWKGIRDWLDGLVDQHESRDLIGGCPIGSLAAEMADRDESLRLAIAEAFQEWESFLIRGLEDMKQRGRLRRGANALELAETVMASIQGGYLLATVKKDIGPMRASVSAAYAHLRLWSSSGKR